MWFEYEPKQTEGTPLTSHLNNLDTQINLKPSAVLLSLLLSHNFLSKVTWKTFQNIILSYPTTVTTT